MGALAEVGAFLVEHADLLGDIVNALEGGLSKDSLRKAIRDAMVAASDAEMRRELDP
jgi:hypothetical protein